jgi:hypothetical protein
VEADIQLAGLCARRGVVKEGGRLKIGHHTVERSNTLRDWHGRRLYKRLFGANGRRKAAVPKFRQHVG